MGLDNLIYLCGPHGSGKTTLSERLALANEKVLIPELYCRNVKFDTDSNYRHILKVGSRAIENFEYLQIAQQNPDKIVIGNRCVYDVLTYNEVYLKKGWINIDEYQNVKKMADILFINENANPKAILLNPGFDAVKRHLEKRWGEKGKKWREEDLEYANLACLEYEKLKGHRGIYYIDHEISLEDSSVIDELNGWIMQAEISLF